MYLFNFYINAKNVFGVFINVENVFGFYINIKNVFGIKKVVRLCLMRELFRYVNLPYSALKYQ